MGTEIAGVIPIVFSPKSSRPNIDAKKFSKNFFDHYDVEKFALGTTYIIKEKVLLENYRAFLSEFHNLIEDVYAPEDLEIFINMPRPKTLDDFVESFHRDSLEGFSPYVYDCESSFSTLGCHCSLYFHFYSGSYRATLEEHRTLLHFEKVLAKVMKNPLADAIKIGLYG
ncbi:MAG: hypothetical protein FWE25_05735 [Lachnospiraceae bacterium]|nr:hypothetical protein [Lachnospiraceae bacterium]